MTWLTSLAPLLLSLATAEDPVQPEIRTAEPETWEFSLNALYSDPPGSGDRFTPIFYADRGALHLELRYGYEDIETASLFAGWRCAVADVPERAFTFDVTPMVGVVAGETDGIAPGLELELGWDRIAWYAEMEYVFDSHDSADDFFYAWSTLMCGVTDSFALGLVTERSKLVDTDYALQRGLALEFTHANFGLALYAYNVGTDDSYAVVSLSLAP